MTFSFARDDFAAAPFFAVSSHEPFVGKLAQEGPVRDMLEAMAC